MIASMTDVTLRKATQADAGRIRQLVIEGGINPFGLDWRRFIVAEDLTGRVIGCVQRKVHKDGSVELASLAVDEIQRGQGVARALIEALVSIHRGDLYLMCRSDLEGFYHKFGFQALARDELPPYFQRIMKVVSWINRITRYSGGPMVMYRDCGDSEVDRTPHLVG